MIQGKKALLALVLGLLLILGGCAGNQGTFTGRDVYKRQGLVICADCGSTMVLHRAHTMKPTQNNFTCRTYKKAGLSLIHI